MALRRERDRPRDTTRSLVDAAGEPTDDLAQAVSGEIAQVDAHGRVRRVRFFLDRGELPWLPMSEPAFLLWVLVLLFAVWVCIGLVLRFA